MKTFTVDVTQTIEVTIDETKFTPEFMEEFRASFFGFEELEEHAEHLAQLQARGLVGDRPDWFIEGYGPMGGMGISFRDGGLCTEIVEIPREVEA